MHETWGPGGKISNDSKYSSATKKRLPFFTFMSKISASKERRPIMGP